MTLLRACRLVTKTWNRGACCECRRRHVRLSFPVALRKVLEDFYTEVNLWDVGDLPWASITVDNAAELTPKFIQTFGPHLRKLNIPSFHITDAEEWCVKLCQFSNLTTLNIHDKGGWHCKLMTLQRSPVNMQTISQLQALKHLALTTYRHKTLFVIEILEFFALTSKLQSLCLHSDTSLLEYISQIQHILNAIPSVSLTLVRRTLFNFYDYSIPLNGKVNVRKLEVCLFETYLDDEKVGQSYFEALQLLLQHSSDTLEELGVEIYSRGANRTLPFHFPFLKRLKSLFLRLSLPHSCNIEFVDFEATLFTKLISTFNFPELKTFSMEQDFGKLKAGQVLFGGDRRFESVTSLSLIFMDLAFDQNLASLFPNATHLRIAFLWMYDDESLAEMLSHRSLQSLDLRAPPHNAPKILRVLSQIYSGRKDSHDGTLTRLNTLTLSFNYRREEASPYVLGNAETLLTLPPLQLSMEYVQMSPTIHEEIKSHHLMFHLNMDMSWRQ